MGNANSHEVGHVAGQEHVDDPSTSSYDKNAPASNLMNHVVQPASVTPTLTPKQLSEISKEIKIKINVDK